MLIPTIYSTIRSPVVDPLQYRYWKAGQTLAQRLAAEYGVIAAGRYTDWTTGRLKATVGDDLDFAYAAGTLAADGSTQAVGLAPLHAGRGVLHDASRTNRLSGDATQARTASLTSGTVYTLWVSSGSAACSYGTATAAAPLTFTATATATVTFTPTGVTRWMLTATAFPIGYYIAPGTTTVNTYGTTTTGVSLPAPVGGDVWDALDGEPDGVELWDDSVALSGSGWSYVGDGVWQCTGGTNDLYINDIMAEGQRARHIFEVLTITSGALQPIVEGTVGTSRNATGVYAEGIYAGAYSKTGLRAQSFVGTIKIHSIQKLQPTELTLIVDDVRLAGSGDAASNADVNIATPMTSHTRNFIRYGPSPLVGVSGDGTAYASVSGSWSRNDNIVSVVNVRNNAGTWQFRVNYVNLTLGQTALAQSDETGWETYDGSFNPDSTLQKLMFHYLNAYPGYLRRYVICNRNLTGAETMELLTKDFTVPAYA